MRGESMKGKSKKSTYSTTFGVDPKKDGRVRISYFQQFAKIFPDEIHNIVATFPNLYALRKESNGTYVLLKEVYPDPEAEKAPDAEAEDDDIPS